MVCLAAGGYAGTVKVPESVPREQAPTSSRRVRPLWVALGWALTGLGFVGLWLPGLPGTLWFVLAAAAFARGDERWEAWLLSRPVVGGLVRDFRSGAGMPLRAKWFASVSIVVAVGFSVPRLPVLAAQVAWALVGAFGVYYVTCRVPTKPHTPWAKEG